MFLKIIVDNFQGIENEIEIDCKALPKKRNSKKIFITPDGVKINKIIGIIGCNASGKTSIFNALTFIDDFISKDSNIEEKIKKFIKAKNNIQRNTRIYIETYIPQGDLIGYYSYDLVYSEQVCKEILRYKKMYSEEWQEIINIENRNFVSDINFKWKYYKNIVENIDKVEYKEIIELDACKTFYEFYINKCMAMGTEDDGNDNLFSYIAMDTKDKTFLSFLTKAGHLVDKSIDRCKIENDQVYFYNKKGKRLEVDQLSIGTRKFIDLMICLSSTVFSKADFIFDEIENHFFSDILEYIYQAYLLDFPHQLIFTTNNKYSFDLKDKNEERYIDNDQVYVLRKENNNINISKNSVRYDKVFSKAYKLCDIDDPSEIYKFARYGLKEKNNIYKRNK